MQKSVRPVVGQTLKVKICSAALRLTDCQFLLSGLSCRILLLDRL